MALLSVLISSILSLILVPSIIRISRRNGWYDVADERKIHTGNTSRLGGIAIFFGFAAAIVSLLIYIDKGLLGVSGIHVALGGAGVMLVFVIGLVDDFHNIPALFKAIGQLVAAVLVVSAGCLVTDIYLPFVSRIVHLGPFAYPLTVIWLVGMSNAVNLIDGMDGLAGGVSLIAAAAFAAIGIVDGNLAMTLVALALFGGAVGFLLFNFPPASIFMGDSGSLVLGFVLALLPLLPTGGSAAPALPLVVPITILFIPILDTAAAILRRLLRGDPIHAPDRKHLHHKLLDIGLSTREALAAIYAVAIVLGAVAVLYRYVGRTVSAAIFVVVVAVGVVGMRMLAVRHARQISLQDGLFLPDNVCAYDPTMSSQEDDDQRRRVAR